MAVELFCTFCGKSHSEVDILITGPTSRICNECVDLCVAVCAENRTLRRLVLTFEPSATLVAQARERAASGSVNASEGLLEGGGT